MINLYRQGDLVRLIRGWTPMVVIGTTDELVYASYFNYSETKLPCSITEFHYKDFKNAYSYKRPQSGFVFWDGKTPNMKVPLPMSQQFQRFTVNLTGETGTRVGTDVDGDLVLRMDKGFFESYSPKDLTIIQPTIFRAKAVAGAYSCYYFASDAYTPAKDDMILSKTGNLFLVTDPDVGHVNNSTVKGTFSGSLLQVARKDI
jgi:hypothetical protein